MRQLERLNIKDVKHLCKHLNCTPKDIKRLTTTPERFYRRDRKTIKGKERPIAEPVGHLRVVLDRLKNLLHRITLPDHLHGGVKGRSPKTNAKCHTGKAAVMKFDLEDYFPSIRPWMVGQMFSEYLGCSLGVTRKLTRLVTLDGGLPQGSPTSTAVANLIIIPIAARIRRLAECHGADYTQFVDDGAISGPAYLEKLRPLVDRIIRQEGLRASPKPKKRTTKYWNEEQTVTGIRVNRGIDVPREKIKKVRKQIESISDGIETGHAPTPKEIASLQGKVRHIATLNPGAAKSLQGKLRRACQSHGRGEAESG